MALQNIFDWVPAVEVKRDPNQLTFFIPQVLIPLTRQIFFKRYMCNIAQNMDFKVNWVDEAQNPIRTMDIEDSLSQDMSDIATQLPPDLFRTKIQVNCGQVKLVTITIFYSTGTILVQGNRCPRWRDEEFESLISCVRAIYAFVGRGKEPGLDETVTSNLRNLRLPTVSPSPTGSGLRDIGSKTTPSPKGQMPRTGASRFSRRLKALSPKSATPSAGQVTPTNAPTQPQPTSPGTPLSARHITPISLTPHPENTHPDLITLLETAKKQIQAQLKQHIKVKVDNLTDTVTSLSNKVIELTKQNKDMKSQIGDLRKCVCALKQAKQQPRPHADTDSETDHEPPLTESPESPETVETVNVETENRFSVLCPSPTDDADRIQHSDRDVNNRDVKTPKQQLAECRVSTGTTHLLIGDSVFRPVKPDLMFPGKSHQKLSISGLAVDDLTHWLQNVPKCRDVQLVVVHVGVNSCWTNTVMESTWRGLLKLLKTVFPDAAIQASSIIPPQGAHPLRKSVAASNAALVKACESEHVVLVDHTDTFTTSSGAPRKALYNDALHPSPRGTIRLACNLKYVGQPRHHPLPHDQLRHRPLLHDRRPRPSSSSTGGNGRVTLLETPSYQSCGEPLPSQRFLSGKETSQQIRNGTVSTSDAPLMQRRPGYDLQTSTLQQRPGDTQQHHHGAHHQHPPYYTGASAWNQRASVDACPPPSYGWYGAPRQQYSYGPPPPPQFGYGPTAQPFLNVPYFSTGVQPQHTRYMNTVETLV